MTGAAETRPPLVSHVSVGVTDLARAGVFYDAAFQALGVGRVMDHPMGLAYGRAFPEFWASVPQDREPATVGNGVHVCFRRVGSGCGGLFPCPRIGRRRP